MGDAPFTYDDLPWAATFSVQAQLKRMADLLVAAVVVAVDGAVHRGGGDVDLAGGSWTDFLFTAAQRLAGASVYRLEVAHHVCTTA